MASGIKDKVAIIGMGCRFPGGASDAEAYWQLLRGGVDADGIADPCDCAPADGGAFDAPPVVAGDRFANATTYRWSSLAAVSGTGTTYDVVRGLVSQLRAAGGFGDAVCVSDNQAAASYTDIDTPAPGDIYYYLARAQNGCGTGGWGKGLLGAERTITICP